MRTLSQWIGGAVLSLFLTGVACAQSSFGTVGGGVVDGKVVMCWNGTNAVPCGNATTPFQMSVSGQIGTANFVTSQTSVANSATLIVAARTGAVGTGRKSVCITQTGSTAVYLGGSGVTTSTGDYLAGTAGAGKCFDTQAAIYGIVATGSQTVSATETY